MLTLIYRWLGVRLPGSLDARLAGKQGWYQFFPLASVGCGELLFNLVNLCICQGSKNPLHTGWAPSFSLLAIGFFITPGSWCHKKAVYSFSLSSSLTEQTAWSGSDEIQQGHMCLCFDFFASSGGSICLLRTRILWMTGLVKLCVVLFDVFPYQLK